MNHVLNILLNFSQFFNLFPFISCVCIVIFCSFFFHFSFLLYIYYVCADAVVTSNISSQSSHHIFDFYFSLKFFFPRTRRKYIIKNHKPFKKLEKNVKRTTNSILNLPSVWYMLKYFVFRIKGRSIFGSGWQNGEFILVDPPGFCIFYILFNFLCISLCVYNIYI